MVTSKAKCQRTLGVARGGQWKQNCTTVLVVQNGQILCESLMFSNCECECD